MDDDELFAAVAAERRKVADLLEGLTPEQLGTPSLCEGWSVQAVAGHLSFAMKPELREFIGQVLRSRGSFDKANDVLARRYGDRPISDIVARMRRYADNRFHPPGPGGRMAPVSDILVHSGDIRLPLGLPHEPEPSFVVNSLRFLATTPFGFVTRGRLRGLRFAAEDADFAHGVGALVAGRAIDLTMAMTGRAAVLERLRGDGVPVLRTRLAAPLQ